MRNYGLKRRCAILLVAALVVNVFDLPVLAAEIPTDVGGGAETLVDNYEDLKIDEVTEIAEENGVSWKIPDETELSEEKSILTSETEELSEETISETKTLIDKDISVSSVEPQNNENTTDTSEETYIDGAGTTQSANDVSALTGEETSLDEGWYVVRGNVNYTAGLTLTGEVHIILADFSNLIIGTEEVPLNSSAISGGNLNIYGQAEGTGSLSINVCSTDTDCDGIVVDNYSQYGGNVTVRSSSADGTCSGNGIYAKNGKFIITDGTLHTNSVGETVALRAKNEIKVDGGIIVADNPDNYGLSSDSNVAYLMYRNMHPGDCLTASSFYFPQGTIVLQQLHCAVCEGDNVDFIAGQGTFTPQQIEDAAGKTLRIACPPQIYDENITISGDGIIEFEDKCYVYAGSKVRINYSVPVPDGYTISFSDCSNISVDSDCTFIMPADIAVLVRPTFIASDVNYIDADGSLKNTGKIKVTMLRETESSLFDGWYIVDGNVTFDHDIVIRGNAHVILTDGSSINIGTQSERPNFGLIQYYSKYDETPKSLSIYGQTEQTGCMNIFSDLQSILFMADCPLMINGGILSCNSLNNSGIEIRLKETVNDAKKSSLDINNSKVIVNSAKDGIRVDGWDPDRDHRSLTCNNSDIIVTTTGTDSYGIYSDGSAYISNSKIISKASSSSKSSICSPYETYCINSDITGISSIGTGISGSYTTVIKDSKFTAEGKLAIGFGYSADITDSEMIATGTDTAIRANILRISNTNIITEAPIYGLYTYELNANNCDITAITTAKESELVNNTPYAGNAIFNSNGEFNISGGKLKLGGTRYGIWLYGNGRLYNCDITSAGDKNNGIVSYGSELILSGNKLQIISDAYCISNEHGYGENNITIKECEGILKSSGASVIGSEHAHVDVSIIGGKIVFENSEESKGIIADNILLGWTDANDYIKSDGYDGNIIVESGKRFIVCSTSNNVETAEKIIGSLNEEITLSEDEINTLAGKTLRAFGYNVTVAEGITHGVSATNIGGKDYYLYKNNDSEVLKALIPNTGMKKIVTTSGTVKPTGKSGEFILTGLDNDATVSFDEVTVAIDDVDVQVYTGNELTPALTVREGDEILTEGTDYIINYLDNIEPGTATATVIGIGAYVGSVTKSFLIAKADHENKEATGTAKFGLIGTIELSGLMESGARLAIENEVSENSIFNATPTISGTKFNYSLKNDSANQGRRETVNVTVKDSDNYKDYIIAVTVTVVNCEHAHTEVRGKKTATCTEKGYTGDTYCMECGNLVTSGSETDIDPNNHLYDIGVVTTEPTVSTEGVKTFTCKRCHHTYTEPVPKLVSKEVIGDINTEDTKGKEGKSSVDVQTHPKDNGSIETTVTVGGQEVAKTVKDQDGNVTDAETKIWIGGLKESYTYTGAAIRPEFKVYDGTKMLRESVDYFLSYANNKNAGSTATITVKFKGNYSGGIKYNGQNKTSLTETFRIDPAALGNDDTAHAVASDLVIVSTGKDQKPVPTISWKETGKSINKSGFTYEYYKGEITDGSKIDSIKDEGTYKVQIKPKESNNNFAGTAQATITVMSGADKNKLMSKASVRFKTYTYTGKAIEPGTDTYTVKLGGQELEKGRHFTVTFSNNVEPGKATAVFTAVQGSGYYGSKTVNFTIAKGRKLLEEGAAGSDFKYGYSKAVPVAKGGAKPGVVVKDGSIILEEGIDYAVSYSRNTKVTDGATAVMTVKGKGKYKGSVKLYYSVTKQDIGVIVKTGGKISAEDKAESNKGFMKPVIKLTDIGGKDLKNGSDYEIVSYTVKGADERVKGTVKAGEQSDLKAEAGDIITVTVNGKGKNYEGTASTDYRYLKESAMLGKVKTKKLDSKSYNGYEVKLTAEDLAGKLYVIENGTEKPLVLGTDYIITGYSNNAKKGTAKVTLQGIGKFGGTRTLSFKITAKTGDCQGALVGGEWK